MRLARPSILFDLKPALDGYAGIPQETRLLFRGLRSLATCDVVGLIQHGARRLRAGSRVTTGGEIPQSARINRSSRVAVSLRGIERGSLAARRPKVNAGTSKVSSWTVMSAIGNFFAYPLARLGDRLGLRVTPGWFESGLFDDFIWRTFFSKTLKSG